MHWLVTCSSVACSLKKHSSHLITLRSDNKANEIYSMLFQKGSCKLVTDVMVITQSELPRPVPRNHVESDHGCTSGIYFDNAGDNVRLTLYNVTLTSQKTC